MNICLLVCLLYGCGHQRQLFPGSTERAPGDSVRTVGERDWGWGGHSPRSWLLAPGDEVSLQRNWPPFSCQTSRMSPLPCNAVTGASSSAPMTPLRSSHSLEGIAALRKTGVLTVTVYYCERRRLRSTWGTIWERPGTSLVAQTALISPSNDV